MTEEEIRQSELPINRAIHRLRNGAPEAEISSSQLGVPDDKVADVLRVAKERITQNDQIYAAMTRKAALGYMAFGSAMLGIACILYQSEVPALRYGWLVIGALLGCASLCWGIFRYFNHDPRYEF